MTAPILGKTFTQQAVFLPDWRAANPYQALMAKALGDQGVEVDFHEMPRGFFALNRLPSPVLAKKIIHLHWINDLIGHAVWPQNRALRWAKLACLGLDILLLRLRGHLVVWTVHNLVSHESQNVEAELAARRMVARSCSRMVLHSESARRTVEGRFGMRFGNKAVVIPHGNYDGCYASDAAALAALKARLAHDPSRINLLFFGAVRRYKGVLPLIQAFSATDNSSLRLTIAGNPNEAELRDTIVAAGTADPRISLVLEFVPDEAVSSYFALADAVIIPFERTLTSGSAVLALTMGKATLLPQEAWIFDLGDDQSSLFFSGIDDLKRLLANLDKQDLARRGIHARVLADALAWSGIAKSLKRVYS